MKLTEAQRKALRNLYDRDRSVAKNYVEFRRRVFPYDDKCVMIEWKGMFLGIEADGYTHS